MKFSLNQYVLKLLLPVVTGLSTGCHSNPKKISIPYNSYRFDNKVIENLPVYDSLVSSILADIDLFRKEMDNNESFPAYRYKPGSNESEVRNKLPLQVGPKIDLYYKKLGNELISGFDVFKDSTVKIYIRIKPFEATKVDIEENLSYYPIEGTIKKREYPSKDTILTKHWQYWMRVNDSHFF